MGSKAITLQPQRRFRRRTIPPKAQRTTETLAEYLRRIGYLRNRATK